MLVPLLIFRVFQNILHTSSLSEAVNLGSVLKVRIVELGKRQ